MLDRLGAQKMSHKNIARMLYDKYLDKGIPGKSRGWWSQMVTVEYEYARGKRTVGETEGAGYEIGVQKAFSIPQKKAWEMLTKTGRDLWLGKTSNIKFKKGFRYKTREGVTGEIRTIVPGEKLRLTWQPKNWPKASTVQIYLLCHRNRPKKTMIHFHQEKLASGQVRSQMRRHWQSVLGKMEKLV